MNSLYALVSFIFNLSVDVSPERIGKLEEADDNFNPHSLPNEII